MGTKEECTVSSLRLEIEQTMGLRFPERNGEALVKFEESMEVPASAELLMRGHYKDPERVKRGFESLHQETSSFLDILLPRRSRLREWAEELPERPKEVEAFLQESSRQMRSREQRLGQVEQELLKDLQESMQENIFPLPLAAFGVCYYREQSVRVYLRPLGRLAETWQLNPEELRQAVRVHFLYLLLLVTGLDLDGQSYVRGEEDPVIQILAGSYTWRYLKKQSTELLRCYGEWMKAWGGKSLPQELIQEQSAEKIRAAMIFWRRQSNVSWEECWYLANQFKKNVTKEYFESGRSYY